MKNLKIKITGGGTREDIAKALKRYFDANSIREDMMSGDYEHAIKVFEKNFGHMVILYR